VIEQVAKELCQGNQDGLEQVEGHRIVELLEGTPLEDVTDPNTPEGSAAAPPPSTQVCNLSLPACCGVSERIAASLCACQGLGPDKV
jgi:hypothetical protein